MNNASSRAARPDDTAAAQPPLAPAIAQGAADVQPAPPGAGGMQEAVAAALPGADDGCFHCGLPVPSGATWQVTIDGAPRSMCCPGCAAVAQTIVDIGQTDYYHQRTGFAATADQASLVPPELALYNNDDPRFAADGDYCEATLLVEGIRCAACVWLIEHRLQSVDGVASASLNVSSEKLQVRWQKDKLQASAILQAVRDIGYAAFPYDAERHGAQLQRASRTLGRQLFVAGLSMMQVMMYVAPSYMAGDDGTLDANMASLMQWASLILTLPAVAYSALPFFQGALASLRARVLGMDVPVAIGIAAAFLGSVAATWRGEGEVYYDSVTMFIFLLLCSRYLEMVARRKAASALERMQQALPASAARLNDWPASRDSTVVPAAALQQGDVILVKPGEAIAADSAILEGRTAVDMSLLTGESAPQSRGVGEEVPGGAINASAAVLLRVLRPARESTLADLLKLIERAGGAKPRIAQWADRVASWFVSALLLFALATFVFWWWHDAARAWPVAIAVLVVSCPCALSLATPSALAAATDYLLSKGVLIVRPHVMETLHRATHIVFDKTGTLTVGRPVVQQVHNFGDNREAVSLQIAAALEAGSAHPIGRAIMAAADAAGAASGLVADEVQELPGQGLEGLVQGQRYRLGNKAFVTGLTGSAPSFDGDGATAVYLGTDGRWLACFLLSDALRPDAQATVDYFRSHGKQLVLLSGDQHALTRGVALDLGIGSAHGEFLPQQKLDYVQKLQAEGAVVAMVGDGINDAAVLSAADVSFAMGSGAALAQAHADTVLLNGQLGAVADTARTAARTMSVIRQNLAWATLYNLVAIPAAAFGWLNPWLSGVGMAVSSAVVVCNALRLRY